MAVRKYVYDGDAVLQEADGAGVTQVTYTRTGGEYGDLLSAYDGTAARYHEPDALGSTDALADQAQAVTDRWAYRAVGTATHTTGTDPTPFTWVGRLGYVSDAETGLYSLGNGTRYYDPTTAQFLSPDPIGFDERDANLRRYAANNPVNLVDPNGLSCLWPARCGADITKKIKGMKAVLDRAFAAPNASDVGNFENCMRSHSQSGWDIEELFNVDNDRAKQNRFAVPGCSQQGCRDRVTVNGKCYFAGHVNYFFWGVLQRRCSELMMTAKVKNLGHTDPWDRYNSSQPYTITFPDGSAIKMPAGVDRWDVGSFSLDYILLLIWGFRANKANNPFRGTKLAKHTDYASRKEWAIAGWDNDLSKLTSSADPNCSACTTEFTGTLTMVVGREEGRVHPWLEEKF